MYTSLTRQDGQHPWVQNYSGAMTNTGALCRAAFNFGGNNSFWFFVVSWDGVTTEQNVYRAFAKDTGNDDPFYNVLTPGISAGYVTSRVNFSDLDGFTRIRKVDVWGKKNISVTILDETDSGLFSGVAACPSDHMGFARVRPEIRLRCSSVWLGMGESAAVASVEVMFRALVVAK
jgi:hypothetical protein